MIVMDLSQVMISNTMVHLQSSNSKEINVDMMRHMILSSIRKNKQNFKSYGEFIIAADDRKYWRKDKFPLYKANRSAAKKADDYDWPTIMKGLHQIRDELKESFPYKVLQVDNAEADDIIGVLAHEHGMPLGGDPFLILSGDRDYIQLHTYANVKQWCPRQDKFVTHNDPEEYLYQHILKGDRGDGIPNVLSPDNALVDGIRQKPITKKRIEEFRTSEGRAEDGVEKRFKRNTELVDLTQVPEDIKNNILEAFNNYELPSRKGLFPYFMKNRLKHLMESINDF